MRLESRLSLQQEVGWDRDTIRMARYLAESQSSPFVISTPGNIKNQLECWKETFSGIQPTFDIAFGTLSETLSNLCSLSVPCRFMTKSQLSQLVGLGFSSSSLVFASSVALGSHLRAAKEANVEEVYCDSAHELVKIKKFHPNCRIILELNSSSQQHKSSLGSESGAALSDIPDIIGKAAELGLNIEGIAMASLKLDSLDPEEQITRVTNMVTFALKALKHIQQDFEGMNIYSLFLPDLCPFWMSNRHPEYVKEVASIIKSSGLLDIDGLVVSGDASDFLVSNSLTLAVMIIDVKSCLDVGVYQIDEGVFGCFSSNLSANGETDVSAPLPLGGGKNRKGLSAKLLVTNIIGSSGDELDMVVEDIVLQRMEVGDWLLFPNIGAKNLSEFNGGKSVKGGQACIYIKTNINGFPETPAFPENMLENPGAGVKTVFLEETEEENGDISVIEGLRGEVVELEDTFINDVM